MGIDEKMKTFGIQLSFLLYYYNTNNILYSGVELYNLIHYTNYINSIKVFTSN